MYILANINNETLIISITSLITAILVGLSTMALTVLTIYEKLSKNNREHKKNLRELTKHQLKQIKDNLDARNKKLAKINQKVTSSDDIKNLIKKLRN